MSSTRDRSINVNTRTPTLDDHLSLWILKLAKVGHRDLQQRSGDDCAAFYEEFFQDKDVEMYQQDMRMVVRRQTITRYLDDHVPPGATLLDCGCGLGDVLAGIPSKYRLHGFDFAQRNVAICQRRLGKRVQINQGSIYEIPIQSDQMDACLCLEVLEHIEDDAKAVREIARVLRPGGILIAAVPYIFYWPQYHALIGHFRHYTRESFTRLMARQGMIVEAWLPNYPRWQRAYTRRYVWTRLQAESFGRIFGQRSSYLFKWPWQSRPLMQRVAETLQPLFRRDAHLDYSRLPTSTFLVARKRSVSC